MFSLRVSNLFTSSKFTPLYLQRSIRLFTNSNTTNSNSGDDTTRTFIDKVVKENDIVVFMKGTPDRPQCGFSRAVCQILDYQGVRNMTALNVLEDEALRNGIKSYSSWPTIPQVFVKGNFIGGCDILMEMHRNGELENLLVKEKIVASNGKVETGNENSEEKK